jgi:hypothetical protein
MRTISMPSRVARTIFSGRSMRIASMLPSPAPIAITARTVAHFIERQQTVGDLERVHLEGADGERAEQNLRSRLRERHH